ncbi:MAG: DNA topoisomerase 1 [Firmicutes bacterium]|nr:DNA topoisomerase 1 [candidate division NPL-UPA2 bacterium]
MIYLPKYLVIVESPAKAKTITKYLGTKYAVKASYGHLRDLPKSQLGVDIDNGFAPKYITIRGKGDTVKELREAAKKADRVFLATDPDREGEAISWHLAHTLDLNLEGALRVTFNEITPSAVQNAFKQPRRIDKDLVDSQQARRILDRIVGYKLSPLLWAKVRKGLSAGRVQSVAVRLIVDREREIGAFQSKEYWTLQASLRPSLAKPFQAKLIGRELSSEAEVDHLSSVLQSLPFVVRAVKQTEKERKPSPPFNTSTLQQEAAKRLGFSAKRTMRIAQTLYEGVELGKEGAVGLITYMRTDSTRLAEEALSAAEAYVRTHFGPPYHSLRQYASKRGPGVNSQDAHEAIRPSYVDRKPDDLKAALSTEQYRLYKLIHDRFLASQMSNARFDTVQVDIQAGDHAFRAVGSRLVFPGYLALYEEESDDEEAKEAGELPVLQVDQALSLVKLMPKQHFTQPPPRYTEASLIKALEEGGIGRPSTYAPILDTIQARGYVGKEQKRFIATELGQVVVDILTEHFPELVEVKFTAAMENKLDAIEHGQTTAVDVLREFYAVFAEQLEKALVGVEKIEVADEVTDEICSLCGRNMVIKDGRFGKFLACPGFPACRNTKPLLKPIGVSCPVCAGNIVERRSKRGRVFFGCSNYPNCGFVVWQKPNETPCSRCGAFTVEKKRRSGEVYSVCGNPACGAVNK